MSDERSVADVSDLSVPDVSDLSKADRVNVYVSRREAQALADEARSLGLEPEAEAVLAAADRLLWALQEVEAAQTAWNALAFEWTALPSSDRVDRQAKLRPALAEARIAAVAAFHELERARESVAETVLAAGTAAASSDGSAINKLRRELVKWAGAWPPTQADIAEAVGWENERSVRFACEKARPRTTWKAELARAEVDRNHADSGPIPAAHLAP